MEKKSKYDTNPLDPDFPKRTGAVPGATDEVAREGEEQTRTLDSERPTRIIETPYQAPTSYPSVFIPPPQAQPPVAQGIPFVPPAVVQPPTSRVIPGINPPENVVMVVPYIPFYLGIAASLIELYLVPRTETRVRFHAAQALSLQLLAVAVQFLLSTIANFTAGAKVGGIIFSILSTIFFIISIIRVWKGEPHHITP
ncbi:MAG: hypothetical protein JO360_14415, partial [Acidobacteria bacterium]|nr:hypothetical protein [Acidobacteriota bacterium]